MNPEVHELRERIFRAHQQTLCALAGKSNEGTAEWAFTLAVDDLIEHLTQAKSLIQSQIDHPWKPNPASEWRDEREASNHRSSRGD